MKKFDLILFNMSNYSEWDEGVSNRNYHVLKQLLQREEIGKILAIDYLPLTFKRAVRNYKEDLVLNVEDSKIIKRSLTHKVSQISDKLYVYSDVNFFLRPNQALRNIKNTALKLNFGDFVVWSFYPFVAPYWQTLGQKLTVFDAVDNWLVHSSYDKYKTRLEESYDIIKNDTDLIFTVSNNLLTFFDNQPNVYWIPNGVDVKHYNQKFSLVNRDIADIPKPIIGYIGVIQEKVDIDLLKYLARQNPKKSFVLVGPVWNEQDKARTELDKEDNIYFLGYKKYSEAPMYIQQFDVGIIPHKQEAFAASTNPMKMYEYLACGKPVVSSQGAGTENISDMISLAKSHEDWHDKINEALKNNTQKIQETRQQFVKQYSWLNTVNKMMDLINNKLS
jgi:teichuronic acid biosynthesis glycosyltransferase TuaH